MAYPDKILTQLKDKNLRSVIIDMSTNYILHITQSVVGNNDMRLLMIKYTFTV